MACLLLALPSLAGAAEPDAFVERGLDEFAQGRFAEALRDWEAADEAGSAAAALFIGVMYDAGQGVGQSDADALAWYRRAAGRGSLPATFNVAVMFDAGRGTVADRAEAARWYGLAADKGFPRAEYNLALLYESGDGVPRDAGRAASLFRAAAGHGLTAARAHLVRLGQRFAGPVRTPRPDSAAAEFDRAQRLLLSRGPAQAAQAAELFRRAGEQRNSLAEYNYAYCLDTGLGVPQDRTLAYVWYRRAAADAANDRLRIMASNNANQVRNRLTLAQINDASQMLSSPR